MQAALAKSRNFAIPRATGAVGPVLFHGRALVAARVVFAAYAAVALFALVAFNHELDRSYQTENLEHWPRHEVVLEGLRQFHMPIDLVAYQTLVTTYLLAGLSFALSGVLMWRASNQVIVHVICLFLIASACAVYPPYLGEVAETNRPLALMGSIATYPFPAGLITLLFVFPDGRFVPGWTKYPVFAGLAFVAYAVLYPSAESVGSGWVDAVVLMFVLVSAVWALVYRYRTTVDNLARRQLRTVGVAIALFVTVFISFNVALDIGNLDDPGFPPMLAVVLVLTQIFSIPSVLLSVALAASVVRDRLFEIEVVLNRTLVFVGLTVAVGSLYAGVVGGAAALFHVNANGLVAVIGAATVALAFQPIRSRMQRGANRLLYGGRDEPYEVVSQLARRMESAAGAETVPNAVVEAVTSALKLPYAVILTARGELLAESGVTATTTFAAPIVHRGEEIGRLAVAPWPGTSLATRDRKLLEEVALQAGAAIHAVTLREDLLRSRERLVTAREEERRRIRRDLHDGLGPRLASLMMRIETERDRGTGSSSPGVMTDLAERVNAAIADIRRLVYGLRPPALDDLGLAGALGQTATLGGGSGPLITVEALRLPTLPAAVEVAAYRIAEEAMTNAVRHSGARHCRVSLQVRESALVVSVEDDGRGFRADVQQGVGLGSMRERAEELGGTLELATGPEGTRICAELPIPRTPEAGHP